jgi:hypothetical protein
MENSDNQPTTKIAQQKYPVPDTLDAIHIKDGTRYEKDQIVVSENYKVCSLMITLTGFIGLHRVYYDS